MQTPERLLQWNSMTSPLQLHDSHREVLALSKRLGSVERECQDLTREEDVSQKPKFTLPELKDILQERNNLKARVSDLEDELSVFRPRNVE